MNSQDKIVSLNQLVVYFTRKFITATNIQVYWNNPHQWYHSGEYIADIIKIKVDDQVISYKDCEFQWIIISKIHTPWIDNQHGFKKGDILWLSDISTTKKSYHDFSYYPSKCYGYDLSKVTMEQIQSSIEKYGASSDKQPVPQVYQPEVDL